VTIGDGERRPLENVADGFLGDASPRPCFCFKPELPPSPGGGHRYDPLSLRGERVRVRVKPFGTAWLKTTGAVRCGVLRNAGATGRLLRMAPPPWSVWRGKPEEETEMPVSHDSAKNNVAVAVIAGCGPTRSTAVTVLPVLAGNHLINC
jgi:hypothetical protein